MKDISFMHCLLRGAVPFVASLAMLAAAQSLPAAGADPSETGQAATDDAAAGGNAQPVTFEAIVLGQIGNDASSKRPLAGAAIEIRRQGDSNAAQRRSATIKDKCR